MLRFHIDAGEQYFFWSCYSNNNRMLFSYQDPAYRLRNCINHVRTITKHFASGTHCIILTQRAEKLRKKLGEPLYGIKSGVCI